MAPNIITETISTISGTRADFDEAHAALYESTLRPAQQTLRLRSALMIKMLLNRLPLCQF